MLGSLQVTNLRCRGRRTETDVRVRQLSRYRHGISPSSRWLMGMEWPPTYREWLLGSHASTCGERSVVNTTGGREPDEGRAAREQRGRSEWVGGEGLPIDFPSPLPALTSAGPASNQVPLKNEKSLYSPDDIQCAALADNIQCAAAVLLRWTRNSAAYKKTMVNNGLSKLYHTR